MPPGALRPGEGMMKPYTKTGDDGTTGRPGGGRTSKSDPLVAAGGAVEELIAHLGLCLTRARDDGAEAIGEALEPVQRELFAAGAMLAAVGTGQRPHVEPEGPSVERIERTVDDAQASLPELRAFILPRGTELACRLHVARTVCRRAERAVVGAAAGGADVPAVVLQYLNRLGDLLFVLARLANHAAGAEEEPWRP